MEYKFDEKKHLHTLDGKPLTGTSSVEKVLAKPLTWWASGLAVGKLGWINSKIKVGGSYKQVPLEERIVAVEKTLGEIKGMTPEEYLSLLDEAYKAHSVKLKDSAGKGTDLHAELESYVKIQIALNKTGTKDITKYPEKIQPFIDWAKLNVKKFIVSEAHCFDEELWVGGITDCVAELNDGKIVIIDFKSSKDAYPTQFIQCAGYAIQIEKNGLFEANGTLVEKLEKPIEALIIIPFGAEVIEPVMRYDVESYKQGFRHAVGLYRLLGLEK